MVMEKDLSKGKKSDYVSNVLTLLLIVVVIITWIYKPHVQRRLEIVEICDGYVVNETDEETLEQFGYTKDPGAVVVLPNYDVG